ncbi:MAG: hypothetical protein Cons2KO_26200 [Congregibacter sp.]
MPWVETFAQTLVPSRLTDGGEAFVRRVLSSTDLPADRVVVHVTGKVDTSGRFTRPATWQSTDSDQKAFEKAVKSAARHLRLSPAVVDSKRRSVWLSFSVVFEHVGGEVEVSVYPYLYSGEGGVQKNYSAPQRVINSGYPNMCRFQEGVIWSSVEVSAAGRPSEPEVVGVEGRCQSVLKQTLLEATYIPAILDGSAVDSSYLEPWFMR